MAAVKQYFFDRYRKEGRYGLWNCDQGEVAIAVVLVEGEAAAAAVEAKAVAAEEDAAAAEMGAERAAA